MGKRARKRRPDGNIEIKVNLGVNPDTGQYVRKPIYGKDEEALEIKAAKLRDAVKKGLYADDKGISFQAYAYSWLNRYKAKPELEDPADGQTYRDYRNIIKNHLGDMRDMKLLQIKKQDIMEAIASLNGHYDLQRRLRMTVNQVLEAAIDEGLVYKNVCKNIKLGKKPKSVQRKFTEAEVKATMAALPLMTPKQRIFVLLLFYTGCRRSEIFALTKTDINFSKKEIDINKAVTHPSNQAVIGPPKTENGYRKIEILMPLFQELHTYVQSCPAAILFPGTNGRYISKTIFRRMWDKIRVIVEEQHDRLYPELAGTFDSDGYSPHRFRHHFCSMLHDAGIPAVDAQRIMGHSDINVTLGLYTHFDEDAAVPMSAQMDQLLKKEVTGAGGDADQSGEIDIEAILERMDAEMYAKLLVAAAGRMVTK